MARVRFLETQAMSNDITRGPLSWLPTFAAVFLGLSGLALLFAGEEVGRATIGRSEVEPFASLLGGALIGFGSMNWISRKLTLGGIYGRSLVAGNQAHFFIGALFLLKYGLRFGGSTGFWILTAAYVVGAVGFTWLLFGPGAKRPS